MKPLISWLEYQQLELICPVTPEPGHYSSSFRLRVEQLWQRLIQPWLESPELQLWCHQDRAGNVWWNAYDPLTQRSIVQVSEDEIRTWVEHRYRSIK